MHAPHSHESPVRPCSWGTGNDWEKAGGGTLAGLPWRMSSAICALEVEGGRRQSFLGFFAWVPLLFSFSGYKAHPCEAGPWAVCTEPPCFCHYSVIPCTELPGHVGEE